MSDVPTGHKHPGDSVHVQSPPVNPMKDSMGDKVHPNAWAKRRAILKLSRGREVLAEVGSRNISVRDAAREAGLSPFHFIRRFEAVFGETPHQFRTRERLAAAQRLLARGRSVTDVCLDVGFSSLGSFSALFTRKIGISPAAYRRSLRCSVYVPDWIPHPPSCLLWMGGTDAIAIFKKTLPRP
jgi:AraC-like DNA-binding protein